MKKVEIKRILEKRDKGELSEEEYRFLMSYYVDRAKRSSEKPNLDDLERNLSRVESYVNKRRMPGKINYGRYVAAALVILSVGIGLYYWLKPDLVEQQKEQMMAVMPAKGKTVLRLPDGKVITIGNSETTVTQDGLILSGGERIDLNHKDYNAQSVLEVETPKGGQFTLQLADGTKVWLNANSKLRYPVAFTGKERSVDLIGEAYFEVAHIAEKPFNVRTNDHRIVVLGTGFNVSAYTNTPHTVTTLIHGKVAVSPASGRTVILSPGEQTVSSVGGLSKEKVDVSKVMAWKTGLFSFYRSDIGAITHELENWYNIKFVIQDPRLQSRKITGEIPRNVNLYDIMEILSFFDIEATISDNTVYLNQKNKKQ